ncbi:MAG: hypothetical protein HYX63_00805 [Gammaproteobacteria bacterium]|nr:hypothetical protein [Gammaproteobacteria bacterium]
MRPKSKEMIQEIVGCLSLTFVIPDAAAHAAKIRNPGGCGDVAWIPDNRAAVSGMTRFGSPDEESWVARATKVQ